MAKIKLSDVYRSATSTERVGITCVLLLAVAGYAVTLAGFWFALTWAQTQPGAVAAPMGVFSALGCQWLLRQVWALAVKVAQVYDRHRARRRNAAHA